MTIPPSPFLSADPPSVEPAAALVSSPQAAAADLDQTDCISEIFHFARQLCADEHRFVLDEQAFMEAIEPLPIFLQGAAE